MSLYFSDNHASAQSQFCNAEHGLSDSSEVLAARDADSFESYMQLANALCYQLRYREAIEIYTKAITADPNSLQAYRQRAARYLTTLQPSKAIEDFQHCIKLGGNIADISYRLGICHYLTGNYQKAMQELETCHPLFDEEMGIAAIFWHTLCAWRSKSFPALLATAYHPNMAVGHHTAYDFAMRTAAGYLSIDSAVEALNAQQDDLEFSIMAYGIYSFLMHCSAQEAAERLLKKIIERDSFWISYCYVAAWNDANNKGLQ